MGETIEKPVVKKKEVNLWEYIGVDALVYDVELATCVDKKGEKRHPSFKYVSGFDSYAQMEIACICVYDFMTGRQWAFSRGNFAEFIDLAASRKDVVGYNSKRFDDNLLNYKKLRVRTTYDVSEELFIASKARDYRGMKLGNVAAINGIAGKLVSRNIKDGADAPKAWQMGHYAEVINYCMEDVLVTARLFLLTSAMMAPGLNNPIKCRTPNSLADSFKKDRGSAISDVELNAMGFTEEDGQWN